nr:DUF3343 domain-containing protein [uncultured Blautia sp.]
MINQEKRLIITFRCTTDAIAMEKSCKAIGAPGRLIPVPRRISASCGLSWCAGLNDLTALEKILQKQELEPEGIYECMI